MWAALVWNPHIYMKTINVTCPNGLVLNAVILRESGDNNNKVIVLLQDRIIIATKVENRWLLLDDTILDLADINLD